MVILKELEDIEDCGIWVHSSTFPNMTTLEIIEMEIDIEWMNLQVMMDPKWTLLSPHSIISKIKWFTKGIARHMVLYP